MSANGIWIVRRYEHCKECNKEVELWEIYHVRRDVDKAVLIYHCSVCFALIDWRYASGAEIAATFLN